MKILIAVLFVLYFWGGHLIANQFMLGTLRHFVMLMLIVCMGMKVPGMVMSALSPARRL